MARRRRHWLLEIAEEVRARAHEAVEDVAAGLRDSVPFGYPPPPPPKLGLQEYLAADPATRQAYLQGLPPEEFSETMSRLQHEAVQRFGAMASTIMPMLTLEEAQGQIERLPATNDPSLGVAAAYAELTELLGTDPFGP